MRGAFVPDSSTVPCLSGTLQSTTQAGTDFPHSPKLHMEDKNQHLDTYPGSEHADAVPHASDVLERGPTKSNKW